MSLTLLGHRLRRFANLARGGLLRAWGALVGDENAELAGVRYQLIGALAAGSGDERWRPRARPLQPPKS